MMSRVPTNTADTVQWATIAPVAYALPASDLPRPATLAVWKFAFDMSLKLAVEPSSVDVVERIEVASIETPAATPGRVRILNPARAGPMTISDDGRARSRKL